MSEPYPDLRLFIDGEWTEGTGTDRIAVENPATGSVLGEIPSASDTDIARAIDAARRAFPGWRATHPRKRAAILRRAAELIVSRSDELSKLMALELGKPVRDGPAEVGCAGELLEWHAEQSLRAFGEVVPGPAGVTQSVLRFPVGPVAAFTPWNGPGASPARKISAALAAGCTIVIKPAEETPATAIALAECFQEAGVPAGVLNMVFGYPARISDLLIASPDIRLVTFTGSVPVGRSLAARAGEHLKPIILELGGHAPCIVCADADPVSAARLSAVAKFRNAGQICISPTRFFLHEDVHDAFVETFVGAAEKLVVGDPLDAATEMGPMIHDRRVAAVDELVRDAVACGAGLATGGGRTGNTGSFYAPTVLVDVPDNARILREEPFGPVAVMQKFSNLEDVCDRANATPYGLAAYAFTNSADTASRITDRVETGILSINQFSGASPEIPFGGVKDSGYGREGGAQCFDGYLTLKSVSHRTSAP